jgi:hypothetical protein
MQRKVHKADETVIRCQLPTLKFLAKPRVQHCRDGTEMLEESQSVHETLERICQGQAAGWRL